MENNFSNAVKAFIVKDGRVLLIKREPTDTHKPGVWDIPGGRLKGGESPFVGLKREIRGETGLEIEILIPLAVNYFTRDDGQVITLLIFLCKPLSGEISLSHEHTEYKWVDLASNKSGFPSWLHSVIDNYFKLKL